MNFLIIGDPIKDLKPKTDSSLAIVREGLIRAHSFHWATCEDLTLWQGRVMVRAEEITGCADHSHPATETVKDMQPINQYDGIWIRKDPPFDQS